MPWPSSGCSWPPPPCASPWWPCGLSSCAASGGEGTQPTWPENWVPRGRCQLLTVSQLLFTGGTSGCLFKYLLQVCSARHLPESIKKVWRKEILSGELTPPNPLTPAQKRPLCLPPRSILLPPCHQRGRFCMASLEDNCFLDSRNVLRLGHSVS